MEKPSLEGVERRSYRVIDFELRETGRRDKPRLRVRGHAAVFDELSADLGGFRERVAPGAFSRAIEEKQDVPLVLSHDDNPLSVLGRTSSGTLRLAEDGVGLDVDADLPDTSAARDLANLMERGDVNEWSFGFRMVRESWEDAAPVPVRTLEDVDLLDVSIVGPGWPAYPAANDAELVEARMLSTALREAREGKRLSGSTRDAILRAMEELTSLLGESEDDGGERSFNPRRRRLELRERSLEIRR